jgi:NAD-dependent DNA ligase
VPASACALRTTKESRVIECPSQLESRAQTVEKLKHFLSGAIVQTKVLLKQ